MSTPTKTSSPPLPKLLLNQFPVTVRRRLYFLVIGNLALLSYIAISTQRVQVVVLADDPDPGSRWERGVVPVVPISIHRVDFT